MAAPDGDAEGVTRIRILRVITRLNIGGPAIQAGLLTARLDPGRFETLLVAGREGPAEGSMLELGRLPAGLTPLVVPSLGRSVSPMADLGALRDVIRVARRYRPDIVHTHLAKAGFVGRVAARLVGAQAVFHTYHGTVFRGYFGPLQTRLYLAVERALASQTTKVIAITPQQRRELLDAGIAPRSKIVEIPLGFELTPFLAPRDQRAARAALGVGPDTPTVGIVARLVPIKDVGTFLRAFAIVRRSMPAAVALIAGDGEERAGLVALASALGIGGSCRFLGWRADMPQVYAGLDVVALSSQNEGSPVSIIEAMAAGRPCVATRVGGVPDVVRDGETGVLVSPNNPEALGAAIVALLRDPERAERLGRNGRERVMPRFDVLRLITDIERLYLDALDRA